MTTEVTPLQMLINKYSAGSPGASASMDSRLADKSDELQRPISPPLSPLHRATAILASAGISNNWAKVQPMWYTSVSDKRSVSSYYSRLNHFHNAYRLEKKPKTAIRKYQPRRIVSRVRSDAETSEATEKTYRTRRVTKRVGQDELVALPVSRPSTPVAKKRQATPASPATHVPVDWESVPDYTPSLDLLPSNNKCLKVEWKGSAMDLSEDPLRPKLHQAELVLASTLRLPCDLYLDSKRRLFMEKVRRLQEGKPFRRTDAQKACRIDVNKASRLFAAYEKIGWLEDALFEKYI